MWATLIACLILLGHMLIQLSNNVIEPLAEIGNSTSHIEQTLDKMKSTIGK